MKLSYLTPLTFPSKYVNRLQVMKMSAAFTTYSDFSLYIAESQILRNELFNAYNVRPFSVTEAGKVVWPPRRIWQALKFLPIIKHAPDDTVWYIRDVLLADWLITFSKKFRSNYFFELHTLSRFSEARYRRVLSRARGIITTNEEKKKDIMERFNIAVKNIFVVPNGVDIEEIRLLKGRKNEIRRELGIAEDARLVVYTGTDEKNYGTNVLREVTKLLQHNIKVLIVSGKPRNEALKYMAAADVLVAPYLGETEHFKKYMSPMKIKEYMAMERPIVVSDLPSIRAILPEDAAFFTQPGNAKELARIIDGALYSNKEVAQKKTKSATILAGQLSWDNRAERIVKFIQQTT